MLIRLLRSLAITVACFMGVLVLVMAKVFPRVESAFDARHAIASPTFHATTGDVGQALFRDYVLPFEAVSFLLLAALIAAGLVEEAAAHEAVSALTTAGLIVAAAGSVALAAARSKGGWQASGKGQPSECNDGERGLGKQALAVADDTRWEELPNVPTVKESGLGIEKGRLGILQYKHQKSLYWGLNERPLAWAD
mgnify:CR=1 FL=1